MKTLISQLGDSRIRLFGTALCVLLFTLASSWVEARWSNPALNYIQVMPAPGDDPADLSWRTQYIPGVESAAVVFRGALAADEVEPTGWANVWFYANETSFPQLAFMPPDPTLSLAVGRLPGQQSLNEAVASHELAQALNLRLGDQITIQYRPFQVVGIWKPSRRAPGNHLQVSAIAVRTILAGQSNPFRVIVHPVQDEDVVIIARRVWDALPTAQVISPEQTRAEFEQERAALLAGWVSALALALLAMLILLSDSQQDILYCAAAGLLGLALAGVAVGLVNRYMAHSLGLTPLYMSFRVVTATFALFTLAAAGSVQFRLRSPPSRWAATVLVLTLAGGAILVIGAFNNALSIPLDEAQRTAIDWIAVSDVGTQQEVIPRLQLLPGILGYTFEATGGLVDENEERWLAAHSNAGILYGIQTIGHDGNLSVPYRLAYEEGRPRNPDNLLEAVAGYDVARANGIHAGDRLHVRGVDLVVVGIRERLKSDWVTDANHRIEVSLAALHRLLHRSTLPTTLTLVIPAANSQQEKSVFLEEVARRLQTGEPVRIEEKLADIALAFPAGWTLRSGDAQSTVRHARTLYRTGSTLIAALLLSIAMLCLATTLRMQRCQDERRTALLKALGLDEGRLFGEGIQKALLVGTVSGVLAVVVGLEACSMLNQTAAPGGVRLLCTPQLGATVFLTILIAVLVLAIMPAIRVAQQDAGWTLYGWAEEAHSAPGGSEP